MHQSADDPSPEPLVVHPAGGASRRELLAQLAARFEEPGDGSLDWAALRDVKRHAWPVPEQRLSQE